MSAFTGRLIIEELKPGRQWQLVEALRYEAGEEGSDRWIVVPAGFVTDGTSIPALLRPVLAVWGTYGRAACIHDLGYRHIRAGSPHPAMPDRKSADREFLVAMRACGTSPAIALALWAAVRLFGWRYC